MHASGNDNSAPAKPSSIAHLLQVWPQGIWVAIVSDIVSDNVTFCVASGVSQAPPRCTHQTPEVRVTRPPVEGGRGSAYLCAALVVRVQLESRGESSSRT